MEMSGQVNTLSAHLGNNTEMDLKEVVGLWASLYPPKIQWWTFMNMIMNLHVYKKQGISLPLGDHLLTCMMTM
jgi:hypothetical protein